MKGKEYNKNTVGTFKGKFNNEGKILDGTYKMKNGDVHMGKFENEKLIDGVKRYKDGAIMSGQFNGDDSKYSYKDKRITKEKFVMIQESKISKDYPNTVFRNTPLEFVNKKDQKLIVVIAKENLKMFNLGNIKYKYVNFIHDPKDINSEFIKENISFTTSGH